MTKDYVIQECLDRDTFRVFFVIQEVKDNGHVFASPRQFDDLEEAKEAVRLIRKHDKQRIYHCVED